MLITHVENQKVIHHKHIDKRRFSNFYFRHQIFYTSIHLVKLYAFARKKNPIDFDYFCVKANVEMSFQALSHQITLKCDHIRGIMGELPD